MLTSTIRPRTESSASSSAFQAFSQANPFFYLIDGFRRGAIGVGDSSLLAGLVITFAINLVLWLIAWRWLTTGYKLKP